MKTFNEFLAKLDKLNFVSIEEKTLMSDNDFGVMYGNQINDFKSVERALTIVVRITYKGQYIMSWGIEEITEENQFLRWFESEKNRIRQEMFDKEEKVRKLGKMIFENL
jgi:hypothetical protein